MDSSIRKEIAGMEINRNGIRRVVITGMGAITPLGEINQLWAGLLAAKSGIRRITHFDPSDLEVQIAGEVDFDPKDYFSPRDARRMSRATQLALIAARMAQQDCGLTKEKVGQNGDRVGVVIGTANAGFELLVDMSYEYLINGKKPMPTVFVNGLPNIPGHYISVEMGATGPLATIVTACASGTQAVGAGVDMIRNRKAELVFAGGADGMIRKEVIAAFDSMRALPRGFNDSPQHASRPFDGNRDGFVLGEGAGILVIESLENAIERGAQIYAEVLGHAASSDAKNITAPDEEGLGAQKAMRWALEDAGISLDEVDYINAHGTSTRLNDLTETKAIKAVFGQRAYRIPVSSTKSMLGHSMGASGALEAIVCVRTIREGMVHPTINNETADPECDLDYVPNRMRREQVKIALSNSFGFGGQNACLVIGKFN
jgi:3-oxoacyl-[acyl-carrier-protein] synthase II